MIFMAQTSRKEAEREHPSATVIKKVDGGYAIFETAEDYHTWNKQK